MRLGKSVIQSIQLDAIEQYPNELCGFVVNSKWVQLDNHHKDPVDNFKILSKNFIKYKDDNIQAVIHSHTITKQCKNNTVDPRSPSIADQVSWKNTDLPWGILATDGETATDLIWLDDNNRPPLLGRSFIYGVYDCWSIIRDWYWMNYDIDLLNIPRDHGWDYRGENLYEDNLEACGLYHVSSADVHIGDILFFKLGCSFYNHAAVYIGDNKIIHHFANRLSEECNYSKWQQRASGYMRCKYLS